MSGIHDLLGSEELPAAPPLGLCHPQHTPFLLQDEASFTLDLLLSLWLTHGSGISKILGLL